MHPLAKALVGVVLVVASLYYIIQGIPGLLKPALTDVLVVLNGSIPLFILLLGIFIVWLEWDEWKIEQELKREERKARQKTRQENN